MVKPVNDERRKSRINWHQALAEVALIGAGVLIALAVDNWWEERLERNAEADYLRALQADFESNKKGLNDRFMQEEQILSWGKELHSHIDSGFNEISSEDLNALIGNFYIIYGWKPITGTYDDMLASGSLLYLQNKMLRNELSQYMHGLEEIKTTESSGWTNWYLEQSPFLRQHLNISRFGWISDYQPVTGIGEDLQALQSREFHNLVTTWIVSHGDVVNDYKRAVIAGDEILGIINSELNTD